MEKKKNNLTKKSKEKKTKTSNKKTGEKKKAFTLIELLAVIIILGVLMIIAIPAVTSYISNSRKSAYIDTAKQVIGATRNIVNSGKLNVFDEDVTYYFPTKCVPVENGKEAESPYGKFTKAYVIVIYENNNFSYYWTSVDSSQIGIKGIIPYNELNEDDIESNVKENEISSDIGIDGRSKTALLSSNCKTFEYENARPDGLSGEVIALANNTTTAEENYLFTDDYGNVRYYGKNPKNYVKFNNEDWQIVGVFDGFVKITKEVPLAGMDYTTAGRNGWTYNVNDWTASNIKEYLNGEYYNNLSTEAKDMIDNHTWKLGGIGSSEGEGWYTTRIYTQERGTDVYSGRPTEWTGYIGLLYPSDYGYATNGGNETNRLTCINMKILDWQNTGVEYCKDNNWMYDGNNVWLLSPININANQVFLYADHGQAGVNGNIYPTGHKVKPAVYLKKTVKIKSGDGSKSNPYILANNH